MYLKYLEMHGFKSFVDATKLEFPRGFTAIVGPNGCGKSNISDAIRWVIGEQSSKTLRGTKMEDLIFNGSDSRKTLGMAEVSMTIANLPKPAQGSSIPVLEEAKVTRRFFRSGESEYFINKAPCRLRDIVDLFLDTGISARAFSIIEQGQVMQIINSKPVDRRYIIEEAAGIMKYKHRRTEALRKMSSAQDNLVRVNDTLTELKRQLGSLKRQASKAEAYRTKKSDLQEASLNIYAIDYKTNLKDFDEISIEHNKVIEEKNKKEAEHTTVSNNLETLRIDISFKEKEINQLNQDGLEKESAMNREEDRIELMKEQIEEVVNDRTRMAEEVSQMEEELQETSQNLSARQEELGQATDDVSSLEATFEEKNGALEEIKNNLDEAKPRMEGFESGLQELDKKISEDGHKTISIRTKLEVLTQREEKINTEEQELSEHLENIQQKEIEAKEQFELVAGKLSIQKEKQQEILDQLEGNRRGLKEIKDELEQAKETKSKLNGKLSSLEDFQKNFEGFQEGSRNLLKKHESTGEPQGVLCALADILETAPEYEIAIETILGNRLQGLIVENLQAGQNALDLLKSEDAGRSTFIPLTPRKVEKPIIFPDTGEANVWRAADLVKTDFKYQDIMDYLLGDVLIVENTEKALELWGKNDTNCTIVTMGGDIIDPHGVIIGGSPAKNDSSLLRKKRIINELTSQLSALSEEMRDQEERLKEKLDCILTLEQEKSDIDEEILATDRQAIHDEKDLHQLRELMERDRKRHEGFQLEIKNILEERERSKEEMDQAELEIKALEAQKEELAEEVANAKEKVARLRDELDQMKEEVNEYNIQLVSLRGRKENLSMDMERLRANIRNIEERIEKRKQSHQEAEEKKLNMEETIEKLKEKILELSHLHDEIRTKAIEKEEGFQEIVARSNILEENAKEAFRELELLRSQAQEIELNKKELQLRIDTVIQRAQDDFDVEPEQLANEYDEAIDREECMEKATRLKEQLSRFNDVNLGALEEYNVIKERFEFMEGQYNDLITSIADLNKAIEKINKTTCQRFRETFEKVSENFKNNFRRLFAGGRAEMILTEPDNILETGIDIIVQPPGKKLQNIISLSAGEKAMTALSVLFSVFMVKPSPFCLLDEVDAPLDEANINRFKEMLRELSDKTQFIIVTHNQTTMTFAETLYGVTMEEKGVSKIVSATLENHPAKELQREELAAAKKSENTSFENLDLDEPKNTDEDDETNGLENLPSEDPPSEELTAEEKPDNTGFGTLDLDAPKNQEQDGESDGEEMEYVAVEQGTEEDNGQLRG